MEADGIIVDTSVIIESFRKQKKEKTLLHRLFRGDAALYISVVTYFELLSGAKTEPLLQDTLDLLDSFEIIDFSQAEANVAADIFQVLREKNALISIADIFIAATALEHKMPIATLNLKHFERIPDLRTIS